MDERIKKLMGFISEDNPEILVSPCEFREEIEEIKKMGRVKCASFDCEKYKECIKINSQLPFLPINAFHTWIVNSANFKMSIGYIFYLASRTLKDFGILAITEGDDTLALSYGFQILYHGEWHYYLKSYKR